ANLDGTSKADIGMDDQVVGWKDAGTVVVDRENTSADGLYSLDVASKVRTLLVRGEKLRVDGIVP
ncbi:MAG: hypothetical protein ACRDG4_14880, partial [Chloroflexota bacterium]